MTPACIAARTSAWVVAEPSPVLRARGMTPIPISSVTVPRGDVEPPPTTAPSAS